jgi:hypothetical protein
MSEREGPFIWEQANPVERADWVRWHIDKIGTDATARLFQISDWAVLNMRQGGEWIPAYDDAMIAAQEQKP